MQVEDVLDAAAEVAEAAAELLKDFSFTGGAGTMPQLVPYDLAGQWRTMPPMRPASTLVAAGLAVVAQDTGRSLLIQRGDEDDDDPAGGCWEFPGGRCEPGENAFQCAAREWQEEIGLALPAGVIAGQWDSTDGRYRGYIWLIRGESMVDLTARDQSTDPDGDTFEAAAWWQASDLPGMPALRDELKEQMDWNLLRSFAVNKYVFAELEQLSGYLRHGKDIRKFHSVWLPEAEMRRIEKDAAQLSGPGACAAARARMIGKAQIPARSLRRAQRREAVLRPLMSRAATQLAALARDAHASHLSFVDAASRVLRDSYVAAYTVGRKHGSQIQPAQKAAPPKPVPAPPPDDIPDGSFDDLPPDVQDDIQSDVDRQHGFLQGLTQDLVAGLGGAALSSRLDQYAASMVPAYEDGFQDGAIDALAPDGTSDGSGIMATWVVTSDDPCALCEEKNGQVWPAEEAPMPGDGGFGEICEGAMNCRCVLEYDLMPADGQDIAA